MWRQTPAEFHCVLTGAIFRERARDFRLALVASAFNGSDPFAAVGEEAPAGANEWADDAPLDEKRADMVAQAARDEAVRRAEWHREWLGEALGSDTDD